MMLCNCSRIHATERKVIAIGIDCVMLKNQLNIPTKVDIKYRPDIDGLRAIAILSVICFHAFPNILKGGFVGVDIFFVISGFLISSIIFNNLNKNTFSFLDFYSRRIKRIFPALIIVILSCLAYGWLVLLSNEYKQLGKHAAAGATFVSNIITRHESGYFDAAAELKPLLHLWSLGIEEQFYLFYPFLLYLISRIRFLNNNLFKLILLLLCASFIWNIITVGRHPVPTFYLIVTRFWELMFGSVLAYTRVYGKQKFFMKARVYVNN